MFDEVLSLPNMAAFFFPPFLTTQEDVVQEASVAFLLQSFGAASQTLRAVPPPLPL